MLTYGWSYPTILAPVLGGCCSQKKTKRGCSAEVRELEQTCWLGQQYQCKQSFPTHLLLHHFLEIGNDRHNPSSKQQEQQHKVELCFQARWWEIRKSCPVSSQQSGCRNTSEIRFKEQTHKTQKIPQKTQTPAKSSLPNLLQQFLSYNEIAVLMDDTQIFRIQFTHSYTLKKLNIYTLVIIQLCLITVLQELFHFAL